MLGIASVRKGAAANQVAAIPSVVSIPIAPAVGPATAWPTGFAAVETNQSYAVTRERRAAGRPLRDRGAEDEEPVEHRVPDPDEGEVRPHPGPGGELAPAVQEVLEEGLRRQRVAAREPERREEDRAHGVAERVETDRPPAPGGRHDGAAQDRPDHVAERHR